MSKKKQSENTATPDKETGSAATESEQVTAVDGKDADKAAESKAEESKAQGGKDDAKDAAKSGKDGAKSETKSATSAKSKTGVDENEPVLDKFSAKIIVVTSGKGGVGKTTTAASISTGLALRGHKTAVIDFDVGLRNLDLLLNCERRVVYDFINVLHGEATLNQALISSKTSDNLSILAASQTKDKDALTMNGVGRVLKELSEMGFEYIVCDSPAGIEKGALLALYYADEAIVTTNPEISSVRDSDRVIGILDAKSRRAIQGWEPVRSKLLLTRYSPERVAIGDMLPLSDVQSSLRIPLLGVIPESQDVLCASNDGNPVILNTESEAGMAYADTVERILGNEVPLRFLSAKPKKGLLQRIFGKQ